MRYRYGSVALTDCFIYIATFRYRFNVRHQKIITLFEGLEPECTQCAAMNQGLGTTYNLSLPSQGCLRRGGGILKVFSSVIV